MARNNPKPSEKLDWVNDDDPAKIIAPTIAQKLAGWVKNQLPPAERFNWGWNLQSKQQIYSNAQVEDWIVIDSDADEGDYATLAAYLADSPAAGDRVLIKEDQTVTAQTIIPDGVDLKFLNGSRLLCATNIATSVLRFDGNNTIEEVLNIVLSHTGTTAKAVEYNGDNTTGKINVENSSTGTLTTAHHINANKTGNQISGFADNTGGGVLTNYGVDNSTEDSNRIEIVDAVNNQIWRSRGAYKFREGLEFDLGSDADGDTYYRDNGILTRLPIGKNGDFLKVDLGIPQWQSLKWNFVKQLGNDLNITGALEPAIAALNGTDIAFIDGSNDQLRTYRFDGTTWSQVGNSLAITGVTIPALAALSSNRVAFIDSGNDQLRTYDFDGTDWAQVGNSLAITGVGIPALTALTSSRVSFIDTNNADLRAYDFDGTDWTLTGSELNISGVSSTVDIAALNATDIAFIDAGNADLRTYRFSGTTWAQVGNDLNISGVVDPAITGMNGVDIALLDSNDDTLRIYRFDGTDWAQNGNSLTIATVTNPCLAGLNGSMVAFIDGNNDDLRTYEWTFSMGGPYHP